MTLKDIKLTEEQQQELKDKLDTWKVAEKQKIEEELTEKYEQMEAQLKEEYENLVEEIKDNMKKVYAKRFTKALKEMYDEIKAEVMVESLNSPEAKALEEIKTIIFPLLNETTAKRYRDEFAKLAEMYENSIEEGEMLRGAHRKAQLLSTLSEDVRKVVDKLLGEGTEEEIVERFASIKSALKEEMAPKRNVVAEDTTSTADTETEEEEEEEEEETKEEEVRVRRTVSEPTREVEEDSKDSEFEKYLTEQLVLAGIKKQKR
jgi:hypothetical protein